MVDVEDRDRFADSRHGGDREVVVAGGERDDQGERTTTSTACEAEDRGEVRRVRNVSGRSDAEDDVTATQATGSASASRLPGEPARRAPRGPSAGRVCGRGDRRVGVMREPSGPSCAAAVRGRHRGAGGW